MHAQAASTAHEDDGGNDDAGGDDGSGDPPAKRSKTNLKKSGASKGSGSDKGKLSTSDLMDKIKALTGGAGEDEDSRSDE